MHVPDVAVSVRKLFAFVVALAVLFAPAVTSAAAASSPVPDHQIQMTETGHCKPVPGGGHVKADGHGCCISVLLGLAVAPFAPLAKVEFLASRPVAFIPTLHRPHLGEIATPPPRHS